MADMERIKRKAQRAVSTVTEKAQDAAVYAGSKAGELRNYAGDKAALMSEKRKLAESYRALGEWYAAHCGDEAPDAVADIVRAIRASQERIEALRK